MVKRKQNTFHATKQKLLPIKWKPAVPGTPYFFTAEFFQGNTKFLGQAVTHSPAEQLWWPKALEPPAVTCQLLQPFPARAGPRGTQQGHSWAQLPPLGARELSQHPPLPWQRAGGICCLVPSVQGGLGAAGSMVALEEKSELY